jgi:hypothetical protein
MGCDHCGSQVDIYRSIREMNKDLPECCGLHMKRNLVAPLVCTDIQPYRSQIDGTYITSRSAHREHLKRHGCIEVGNEVKHLMNKSKPVGPPVGLKEKIIEVANAKLREA